MDIDLCWLASMSTSCFYAAGALARGRAGVDSDLAAVVAEPARWLAKAIERAGLPADRFWRQLVALSAEIDGNRQLAEAAVAKTIGRHDGARVAIEPLAAAISGLEAAVLHACPKMMDELAEWSAPLRAAWNAQGPALLGSMARLTDPRLVVPRADVVLVYPTTYGGGTANLQYNSVCLEAVRGNPVPALPELVRLAWLLGQLNVDLPLFGEGIAPSRLVPVGVAGMLPPVLAAADELGLARCDGTTIRVALEGAEIELPGAAAAADTVLLWWETYLDSRPAWNVALAALDRMLYQAAKEIS